MGSKALEDFIKYAWEQFGYSIVLDSSDEPDSFESIFGGSFFQQDDNVEIEDGFYTNSSLNVQFCMENVINFSNINDIDFSNINDIDLAA